MANEERNNNMHAKRGSIKMVVASVTALKRHRTILAKQNADWLALAGARVSRSKIQVIRTQLLHSGYNSVR